MKPRLLDLFCGAGGCSVGYHRAGFDVVGVDVKPQPNYPFDFVQADVMEVLADRELMPGWWDTFDVIHASPPCQAYSTMRVMHNARQDHPDLVEATRGLLMETGLPWVMENVVGAPLKAGPPDLFDRNTGITLCGSMFGLHNSEFELRRHRLFESNVPLDQPRCDHRLPVIGFYGDHARTRQRTIEGHRDRGGDITGLDRKMPLVRDLMGIDWMRWEEAVLAIPPAYTEHIGGQLAAYLRPDPPEGEYRQELEAMAKAQMRPLPDGSRVVHTTITPLRPAGCGNGCRIGSGDHVFTDGSCPVHTLDGERA